MGLADLQLQLDMPLFKQTSDEYLSAKLVCNEVEEVGITDIP